MRIHVILVHIQYREAAIVVESTAYELRLVLGIETRHELDGFLKARGVYEPVTLEDVRREVETLKRLGY